MATYLVPRNVKGESRILLIFTTKSFLFMLVGLVVGAIFYSIFSMIGFGVVGVIFLILFGAIGFVIGAIKIPDTNAFDFTKKTGGEYIDDILLRYIKFKKSKKIYVYERRLDDGVK